jgi:hypothetical protein
MKTPKSFKIRSPGQPGPEAELACLGPGFVIYTRNHGKFAGFWLILAVYAL